MINILDDCTLCGNKPTIKMDLPNITINCCKLIVHGRITFESKLIDEWNQKNKNR